MLGLGAARRARRARWSVCLNSRRRRSMPALAPGDGRARWRSCSSGGGCARIEAGAAARALTARPGRGPERVSLTGTVEQGRPAVERDSVRPGRPPPLASPWPARGLRAGAALPPWGSPLRAPRPPVVASGRWADRRSGRGMGRAGETGPADRRRGTREHPRPRLGSARGRRVNQPHFFGDRCNEGVPRLRFPGARARPLLGTAPRRGERCPGGPGPTRRAFSPIRPRPCAKESTRPTSVRATGTSFPPRSSCWQRLASHRPRAHSLRSVTRSGRRSPWIRRWLARWKRTRASSSRVPHRPTRASCPPGTGGRRSGPSGSRSVDRRWET